MPANAGKLLSVGDVPRRVSAPVAGAGEYYVIKVLELQESKQLGYEEARQMIIESLKKKRERQVIDEWYIQAREQAEIEYVQNN